MSSSSTCYVKARWATCGSSFTNKTILLDNITPQAITSHEAKLQVPALEGQGAPDVESHANIPLAQLPHDPQGHLLRPGVVWYAQFVLSFGVLVSALACGSGLRPLHWCIGKC